MSTVTLLSGGVGGARMARGITALPGVHDPTIVVNVGDDEEFYGVFVSADLDTVLYTLAGKEGPHGWGVAGDTFTVMEQMARLGVDTTFSVGDTDLAHILVRTAALRSGETLSAATTQLSDALDIGARLLPATDDRLRTVVTTAAGERLSFQEYFVIRRHEDEVAAVEYQGAADTRPAPGVMEAIAGADLVVIAPSNPPLSIWPILAVPGIRDAVAAARVAAVSPLFGGRALKGPADRVMAGLGLPAGTEGILAAYDGLLDLLVVDETDRADTGTYGRTRVVSTDTRIAETDAAARLASFVLEEAL